MKDLACLILILFTAKAAFCLDLSWLDKGAKRRPPTQEAEIDAVIKDFPEADATSDDPTLGEGNRSPLGDLTAPSPHPSPQDTNSYSLYRGQAQLENPHDDGSQDDGSQDDGSQDDGSQDDGYPDYPGAGKFSVDQSPSPALPGIITL